MQKKFGKTAWDAYRNVTAVTGDERPIPEWHYLASDAQRAWDVFGASVVDGATVGQAFHKFQTSFSDLSGCEKDAFTALPEEYRLFWVKAFEAVRAEQHDNSTNDAKRTQDKRMYDIIRENISERGSNYRHMISSLASHQRMDSVQAPKDVHAKHVIGARKYSAHNLYRFTYYTREGCLLTCDVPCDGLNKDLQACSSIHPRNFDYIPHVVTFGEAFRALTEYRCRIYRPEWLVPYPVGLADDGSVVNKYKLLAWLSYTSNEDKPRIYKKGIINDTSTVMTTLWEPNQEDLFSAWISKRKGH